MCRAISPLSPTPLPLCAQDHVCIPRDQMLMRYATVTKEGKYIPPPASNAKASYATMVYVRSDIVRGAGGQLAKAVTIATRYAAVRRQTAAAAGERELQVGSGCWQGLHSRLRYPHGMKLLSFQQGSVSHHSVRHHNSWTYTKPNSSHTNTCISISLPCALYIFHPHPTLRNLCSYERTCQTCWL